MKHDDDNEKLGDLLKKMEQENQLAQEQKEKEEHVVICYSCKKELHFDIGQKISRQEECSNCKINLYCCKMCSFYNVNVYNECREPNAERLLDKEKVNYCSYFTIRRGFINNDDGQDQKLDAAESLFKD